MHDGLRVSSQKTAWDSKSSKVEWDGCGCEHCLLQYFERPKPVVKEGAGETRILHPVVAVSDWNEPLSHNKKYGTTCFRFATGCVALVP